MKRQLRFGEKQIESYTYFFSWSFVRFKELQLLSYVSKDDSFRVNKAPNKVSTSIFAFSVYFLLSFSCN